MTMRKWMAAGLALAALAACRGEAPEAAARPGLAHEQMVAALQGRYIWDCTLTGEAEPEPWRFVLQRQGTGGASDVVVLQADGVRQRRVDLVQNNNAARIYIMRDGSRVLVASDGEVRSEGRGGSKGRDYTEGRCRKGSQPA